MYKPTIWQDHVEGVQEGTDVNAKNLNNIEIGVMEAAALAALNAENSRHAAATANNNNERLTSLIRQIQEAERFYVKKVYLTSSEKSQEVPVPELVDAWGYHYYVTLVICEIDGGSAGDIIVSNRTTKSFFIEYTGTANAVTIDVTIRIGEMWFV